MKKAIIYLPLLLGAFFLLSFFNYRTDADMAIGLGGVLIVLMTLFYIIEKAKLPIIWICIILGILFFAVGMTGSTVFQSFISVIGGLSFTFGIVNFAKR